jgi:hypothetical protein
MLFAYRQADRLVSNYFISWCSAIVVAVFIPVILSLVFKEKEKPLK